MNLIYGTYMNITFKKIFDTINKKQLIIKSFGMY